jgi:hypothetical protein
MRPTGVSSVARSEAGRIGVTSSTPLSRPCARCSSTGPDAELHCDGAEECSSRQSTSFPSDSEDFPSSILMTQLDAGAIRAHRPVVQ